MNKTMQDLIDSGFVKPCGYIDTNGEQHIFENGELINVTEEKSNYIKKQLKDIMTLDELENAYLMYDSNDYNLFFNAFKTAINNLNSDDKFVLYKDLYTNAKEGNKSVVELLKKEVKLNGIPEVERDNIVENIKFDSNGLVNVYRGINKHNDINGGSYTLEKEKAIWFSTRFGGKENIITKKINLEDIVFYFNGREEQEVFLNI